MSRDPSGAAFEFSGNNPLAEELALHLGDGIVARTYPRGSKMPTVRALAAQYDVSRKTVERALDRLEEQGLIFRRVGKGTFVRKDPGGNGDSDTSRPKVVLVSFKYTNPYSDRLISNLFDGMNRVLQEKGSSFAVCTLECGEEDHGRDADCRKLVEELRGVGPDGVIFAAEPTAMAIRMLSEVAPVLQAGYFIEDEGAGYVGADMLDGMRKAIGYLKMLGHTKVAMITHHIGEEDHRNFPTVASRVDTYQAVMAEMGLAEGTLVIPRAELAAAVSPASGHTAIVATATSIARDVIDAAAQRGVRIPEDLSLIGYDDASIGESTIPRYTSMRHLSQRMGELAADKLLGIIAGTEALPVRLILPAELVVRESCAPPKVRSRGGRR